MVTRKIISAVAMAGRTVHRFLGNRSGVAAVEFAILLPIMVLLYIGGLEISDGFTIKRKVTNATSALDDLVTRTKSITLAEMEAILDAAGAVIAPYSADEMKIKITGVNIDGDSQATVCWGAQRNDTANNEGDSISLPEGVSLPDSFLVVAEVHYLFEPAIGYVISGTVDIGDTFYLKPRLSPTVSYDGAC